MTERPLHPLRAPRRAKDRRRGWARRRQRLLGVGLAALATCLGLTALLAGTRPETCGGSCPAGSPVAVLATAPPHDATSVRVGGPLAVQPIGAGFLGLSTEYYALRSYAGVDPNRADPVFLRLVRALDPGQAPVIRIGGDSADWTWVPGAHRARPAGGRVAITPDLVRMLGATARDLGAQLILDLDLEADSPRLASIEATTLLRGVGRAHIRAFELGNEPELYDVLGWYQAHGAPVLGRAPGYDLGDYTAEFGAFARELPPVALAGPSSGDPAWAGDLAGFVGAVPRLAVVTVHRYPLQRCAIEPGTPLYPTIHELLAPPASAGLADSVIPDVAAAHAHGEALRVDELNSVACFGAPGVSNTFAAALWALSAAFDMAQVGVDGLNFHTLPAAAYNLFDVRRSRGTWGARVAPEYYGLLLFARAAPPGSRLLATRTSGGALRAWATDAPGGALHVVLENPSPDRATAAAVHVPAAAGLAGLTYLRAPHVNAVTGVTLGGQSFGSRTGSGVLVGVVRPVAIRAVGGDYVVRVPAATAAMLTLQARPAG